MQFDGNMKFQRSIDSFRPVTAIKSRSHLKNHLKKTNGYLYQHYALRQAKPEMASWPIVSVIHSRIQFQEGDSNIPSEKTDCQNKVEFILPDIHVCGETRPRSHAKSVHSGAMQSDCPQLLLQSVS